MPQPVVKSTMFEKQRQTQYTKALTMNLQVSDLIRAWATVLYKRTWRQNPEITKCAVWNCCLHFSLVGSMKVDCRRDERAKRAKDTRKLHPSKLFGKPHTSCLSLKNKWLVWSLHLFILLAFLWKWSYNKQTFWKSCLCMKSWLWGFVKALVTSTLFNFLVSNFWLDTTHPSDSPHFFFFLLFSPHPQFNKSKNFPALNTPYCSPSFNTAGNKTAQSFCEAPVTGHLQTGEEEGQRASG